LLGTFQSLSAHNFYNFSYISQFLAKDDHLSALSQFLAKQHYISQFLAKQAFSAIILQILHVKAFWLDTPLGEAEGIGLIHVYVRDQDYD